MRVWSSAVSNIERSLKGEEVVGGDSEKGRLGVLKEGFGCDDGRDGRLACLNDGGRRYGIVARIQSREAFDEQRQWKIVPGTAALNGHLEETSDVEMSTTQ